MKNVAIIILITICSCSQKDNSNSMQAKIDSLGVAISALQRSPDTLKIIPFNDSVLTLIGTGSIKMEVLKLPALTMKRATAIQLTSKDAAQDKSLSTLTTLTTTQAAAIKILQTQIIAALKKDTLGSPLIKLKSPGNYIINQDTSLLNKINSVSKRVTDLEVKSKL